MPFTEDLTPFFNTAEFAHNATLDGVAVKGIFDNEYMLDNMDGVGFNTANPAFSLSSSSITGDPTGKVLVVNATNYTVVAHEPDSTGVARLQLEKT